MRSKSRDSPQRLGWQWTSKPSELKDGLEPVHCSVSGDEVQELPGTRRLFDSDGRVFLPSGANGSPPKRHGDIVLIPQPADSPNDPLLWGLGRKMWHTALVCFVMALTAATKNDAGTAADGFNEELGIDKSYLHTGVGLLFIGIGYWVFLSSPAVYLYGRRVLYLFTLFLNMIGNIWYGAAHDTYDIILSMLFVGASEAVAEALVQLSLMDCWFEHQVGAAMSLYVLATSVGTYVGPLVATYVAQSYLGYRWVGYMGSFISGVTMLLLYFGLEETRFDRARYTAMHRPRGVEPVGRPADATLKKEEKKEKKKKKKKEEEGHADHADHPDEARAGADEAKSSGIATLLAMDVERAGSRFGSPVEKRKSYWQRLRIISPAPNLRGTGLKQYFRRLLQTLKVFTFPAVWYAGLQWGMQNTWLNLYRTVEQDTWYGPPRNYTRDEVGNMNVPTLIGSVIGCLMTGWGSDWFTFWVARRRDGIMEAESRLWLMIFPITICPTGMFLFGIASCQGWSWPVPYLGLCFIGFGYGCAGDLSMAYLVDAYPEMVLEGMVCVAVINNTIGCIFSFIVRPWIDSSGTLNTLITAGVLAFATLAISVPMAWLGKGVRRRTQDRYKRFIADRDRL